MNIFCSLMQNFILYIIYIYNPTADIIKFICFRTRYTIAILKTFFPPCANNPSKIIIRIWSATLSPTVLFIKVDSLRTVLWSVLISFIACSSPEVIRSEGYRTGILRVAMRNATRELYGANVRERERAAAEKQIGSSNMSAARTKAGTRRRNNCLGSCYSAHDPVDKRIRPTEVTARGRSDKGLCKLRF